jgi:hypothetical protein
MLGGENKCLTLVNGTFTASQDSGTRDGRFYRGVILVIDVTAAPGAQNLVVTLEGVDPVSGKFWSILASAAITAISTTVLKVFPGLTASANAVANDVLPPAWHVKVTNSGAGSWTYTVAAHLLAG